jgi:hypothetical protein
MSFLLCHDCYTWVEPDEGRCPECLLMMDLSAADPASAQLRDLMGDIVDRLGEVRVPRKLLPEWGTLYATTRGLFFVPHEPGHSTTTGTAPLVGASLVWGLGSLFWSPLLFLMPFVRTETAEETTVRVLRPRYLTHDDSSRMPELLMAHPGSFFLPKTQIKSIRSQRARWTVERSPGSRLMFSPVDSPRALAAKLSSLLATSDWTTVGRF